MTIFDSITFGDFLLVYRKKHHLTRQVLAARLSVRMTTLQNWENGICSPSLKSMVKISEEMKVPLAVIYKLKKQSDV